MIITATYSDGKIDEKDLPYRTIIQIGHGQERTDIEVDGIKVIICHEAGEQLPEVTIRFFDDKWKPQVGDGCSYGYNGDSYPYTVRRVSPSGKTIWVSADRYEVKPGKGSFYEEGAKDCFFHPQDVADTQWLCYKLKKDGRYRPAGKMHRGCPSLRPGRCYSQNPHV